MLIDNHKKPFRRAVRSYSGAMKRQYINETYDYKESIYISLGGQDGNSAIEYIDYSDWSSVSN